MKAKKNELTAEQMSTLLATLEARFEANMHRHKGMKWKDVHQKLLQNADKCWSLHQMEATGGAPDVIVFENKKDGLFFCDCSPESPAGRRSLCYDPESLAARKENKPKHSAWGLAQEMGITLLTEDQYHYIQKLEPFDLKTSSWLHAPTTIRELGGAIFGDRRFGRVFVYHNGAESYYAGRAFRGLLSI